MIRSGSAILLGVLLSALPAEAQWNSRDGSAAAGLSAWSEPSSFNRTGIVSQHSDTTLPEPQAVMFKSMMLPGWGQVVNRQAWKVPIVYGLIGGLAGYSVYLTRQYHDYRAAYYNLNPNSPDDFRFGQTPSYIPATANLESLRFTRDGLRNRRDLIYVTVGLAYGLNIVDAYVFAHMRSFDVSEDLSMTTTIEPGLTAFATPGVTLSVKLFRKR